jgi:hypothetical protein
MAFVNRTGRNLEAMVAAAEREYQACKGLPQPFHRPPPAAIDLESALDLIYGPLFYGPLVSHAPLDGDFTDEVLDEVLRGLGPVMRSG